MTSPQLLEKLKTLKAYKKERLQLGIAAVNYNLLANLIAYCNPQSGVSHQACWVLEQSFLEHEAACLNHLDAISELYTFAINSSGNRSLSKMASIITKKYYSKKPNPYKELLTQPMRERMLDGCFQMLLDDGDRTANLAFASRAVYELGKEFDWVHAALQVNIQEHLERNPHTGFRACGGAILAKIAG